MKIPAKNTWMRAVNYGLFLGRSLLAGSGWLLAERLPHGGGGRGAAVLELTRHDWREMHELAGFCVVGLVLLHLALNWNWLVIIAASRARWRLAGGLLLGAGVVGLLALASVTGE